MDITNSSQKTNNSCSDVLPKENSRLHLILTEKKNRKDTYITNRKYNSNTEEKETLPKKL